MQRFVFSEDLEAAFVKKAASVGLTDLKGIGLWVAFEPVFTMLCLRKESRLCVNL